MNILHQSNGYCQFPRNILDKVALTYQQVQAHYVRRGNYKRAILAIIMYYNCLADGFVRPYTEIAKFTNTTCCFSYGADIVRSMVEQDQITLEIDINPLIPFINTILLQLSQQDNKLAKDEIIITMNQILQLHIGNNIKLRNKIIVVAYLILNKIIPTKEFTPEFVEHKCCIGKMTFKNTMRLILQYQTRLPKFNK